MPGGKRTQNQELAALALASGKTNAEAATAASVSERTVCDWKTDAAFQTLVRELRSQMISAAASKLASSMGKAAEVLEKLLDSTDEDVRRHAAVKIIELGVKTTELEELQRQVEDLECRLNGMVKQQ